LLSDDPTVFTANIQQLLSNIHPNPWKPFLARNSIYPWKSFLARNSRYKKCASAKLTWNFTRIICDHQTMPDKLLDLEAVVLLNCCNFKTFHLSVSTTA
jgi:hypothetical protein